MPRRFATAVTFLSLGTLALATVHPHGANGAIRRRTIKRAMATTTTTAAEPQFAAGDTPITLAIGGVSRTATVHVPTSALATRTKRPLLLGLHGGGGSGTQFAGATVLNTQADRDGFVVVYPDGIDRAWNDGRYRTSTQQTDDLAFLTELVTFTQRRAPIDRARVFSTGISNGAFMSNWLACQVPGLLRGMVLVVGTGPEDMVGRCANAKPLSIVALHGTADPLVPYNGGDVGGALARNRGSSIGVDPFAEFWVKINRCAGAPTVRALTDTNPTDGSTINSRSWTSCAPGITTEFLRIDGGGHTWPGEPKPLPKRIVGTTNYDVSASELVARLIAASEA
jgi:polyhydroxybutyrate depolymerase